MLQKTLEQENQFNLVLHFIRCRSGFESDHNYSNKRYKKHKTQ